MNIVFFGSPQTAVLSLNALLKDGHDIKLAVTQPDRPSGRGRKTAAPPVKVFAGKQGIPVIQPAKIRKDPGAFGQIQTAEPDLNVVVAYGQIIPSQIIYLPRFNTVNLHFSLLPKYRGASPVQWALREGETETGLTIFELNEKMDEGPILSQKKVSVLPGEDAGELEHRLSHVGAEFLAETVSRIHELKPRPQNHAEATYAPLIKKQDGHIDWSMSSEKVDRLVRAFTPWPSAFTFYKGKRIKILRGSPANSAAGKGTGSAPGEILDVVKKGITVSCGSNTGYRMDKIHPENKKPMDAYAFSLGAGIKPGDRLD